MTCPLHDPKSHTHRTSRLMLLAALLTVAVLAMGAPAQAQDIVYYGEDFGRCTRLHGGVVDYNGQELVLSIPGGMERRFPAAGVLKIETKRTAQQEEGDRLFAQGQWQQALRAYMAAETQEPRAWVRRELMAQVVWCHHYLDQDHLAGEHFLALLASDPKTPYFDCIPLAWITREATPALEAKAAQWLQNQNSTAQLLGASHLLGTSQRAAAVEHLKQLRFDSDPRIAALARCQLWRSQAVVNATTIAEWEKLLSSVPESLRAGPYFVLATAYSRQVQPEVAALTYLKVPVLFPKARRLAARALAEAAQESVRLGREEDARLLRRELLQQHPGTAEATEAARQLRTQGDH